MSLVFSRHRLPTRVVVAVVDDVDDADAERSFCCFGKSGLSRYDRRPMTGYSVFVLRCTCAISKNKSHLDRCTIQANN